MNDVEMNAYRDEDRLFLILPLLRALKRNLWIVILVAVLFGGAGYTASKMFITPTYKTSFTAYVNNRNQGEDSTSVSSADLSASRSLVQTYGEILTSRSVLAAASEKIGGYYTYGQLTDMITVDTVDNTEIISIGVIMDDPQAALDLAEAVAEVAPEQVAKIVEGSSMQIIDAPTFPTSVYGPNNKKNALLAAILGGALVVVIIILKELLDDRVKDEAGLEERYDITIIGVIPDLVTAAKHEYTYGYNKKER